MEQIQLNTLKESVKKGRIANTYLLAGKANSDVLGAGLELVKDIIKPLCWNGNTPTTRGFGN